MLKKSLLAVLFSLILGVVIFSVVEAQQPTPSDDQVNAIAHQLYCPVCENITLDVCPTTACAQWRDLIRQKLVAGWNEQQIKDYFVQQYGARVLGVPQNKIIYVLLFLIIIAGIYILYLAFRSWRRPAMQSTTDSPEPPQPNNQPSAQDEYIKQVEDQVRKS